jgi:hypothetical protein
MSFQLRAYDKDYYDENHIALRKGIVKIVRTINGKKIVWYLKKSKIINSKKTKMPVAGHATGILQCSHLFH